MSKNIGKIKQKFAILLILIIACTNIYEVDFQSKKIVKISNSYAIEPVTATIIATVLASLALSLGFKLVDSTSESFTEGCMTLYNNFSTNLKNIIDRIAGEKEAGNSTFDISPQEMELFANELSSLISENPESIYPFDDVLQPAGDNSNTYKTFYGTEFKYDPKFEIGVRYKSIAEVYNLDGTVRAQKVFYIKFTNDLKIDFYADATTTTKLGSGFTSFKPSIVYNYGNSTYYPAPTSVFALSMQQSGFIIPKTRLVIGDEEVKVNVIQPTNINTTELVNALIASGALNGQGNVTQNFITNTTTAVPSDSYTDVRAKSAVDGLFDGADTNVPDVPADWGIVRSLYDVLQKIYTSVKTGISSLYNVAVDTLTAIQDFVLDDVSSLQLNFESFKNIQIFDKFPFCIPFDLVEAFKKFNVGVQTPVFSIDIESKWLNIHHVIDFSFAVPYIIFFRWVANIWFTIFLMLKTRDLIKW